MRSAYHDKLASTDLGNIFQLRLTYTATDVRAQPFETLVKTVTASCASSLDIPGPLPQTMQTELIGNLRSVHSIRQILLVGEDEKESITELILVEHSLKFFASFRHTFTIVGIDDEDDTLCVLEVVPPEGTDLVLTSNVPDGERNVLVLDGLDIEADGRDGRNDFAKLQLVQDGGLTSGIETHHQDTHLLLAKETREKLGN